MNFRQKLYTGFKSRLFNFGGAPLLFGKKERGAEIFGWVISLKDASHFENLGVLKFFKVRKNLRDASHF